MASIVTLGRIKAIKGGRLPKRWKRAIDFTIERGGMVKRVHLGLVDMEEANRFAERIEGLVSCHRMHQAPLPELAAWLGGLSDDMHDRIARTGLIAPKVPVAPKEAAPRLFKFMERFVAAVEPSVKPNTARLLRQTQSKLREFFAEDPAIDTITRDRAADWRAWLVEHRDAEGAKHKLAEGTVRLHVRNAKWMFGDSEHGAVGRELLQRSPFGKLTSASVAAVMEHYVSAADAEAILAELPTAEWRALFGLARFAGLSCSSETHGVMWADVDWESRRLRVRAPKTDSERMVPIVPRLHDLLRDAFETAPDGSVAVVGLPTTANLPHVLKAAIRRAKQTVWPDLFQTLRRSFETEMRQDFPEHVAAAWTGHSAAVGRKHYAMVRDDDFTRAAGLTADAQRIAQRQDGEPCGTEENGAAEPQSGTEDELAETAGISAGCASVPDNASGPAEIRTRDLTIMSRLL